MVADTEVATAGFAAGSIADLDTRRLAGILVECSFGGQALAAHTPEVRILGVRTPEQPKLGCSLS